MLYPKPAPEWREAHAVDTTDMQWDVCFRSLALERCHPMTLGEKIGFRCGLVF